MHINPQTHSPRTGRPWNSLQLNEPAEVPLLVPESPLYQLLDRIPRDERRRIKGVMLGPKLGYRAKLFFRTADDLHRWLVPQKVTTASFWRAESFRMHSFSAPLSIDDLRRASHQCPPFLCDEDLEAGADGDVIQL